jgi:hypothetical protein
MIPAFLRGLLGGLVVFSLGAAVAARPPLPPLQLMALLLLASLGFALVGIAQELRRVKR